MFGLFKKKYSILKPDMIEPVDMLITTTLAKKLYKQYMRDIGYLEKDDLSEQARCLGEEIKYQEECLKVDRDDKKEEITFFKERIKELKKKLPDCSAEEKEKIDQDIEDDKEEIDFAAKELEEATKELTEFKKDKRTFLVDYINTEIHGHDWKSK